MRIRLLLGISVVVALLAIAPAALGATTKQVSITSGGFSPKTVSITADDSIRWKNNDSKNHQIVSTRGTFASPVIGPGKTYTFTFQEAGTYDYRDALYPSRTGTVKVAGLPPAVTFGVSLPQIGYGTAVTLTGQVNNKRSGEQVTLASTPYGQLSPVVLANVVTGANGVFAYTTKPQLLTSYIATWKGATSLAATVAVAPVITFGRNNGWVSKIYAGRSMVAKTIQVQTVSKFGQWVTIKRVRVGSGNMARFTLPLSKGVHKLRVAMSVNQAGVGYLGAYSSEVTWRTP
jgi:plastocyanin